jgi:hypothetical protein
MFWFVFDRMGINCIFRTWHVYFFSTRWKNACIFGKVSLMNIGHRAAKSILNAIDFRSSHSISFYIDSLFLLSICIFITNGERSFWIYISTRLCTFWLLQYLNSNWTSEMGPFARRILSSKRCNPQDCSIIPNVSTLLPKKYSVTLCDK